MTAHERAAASPATAAAGVDAPRRGSLGRAGGVAAHVVAGTYVLGFLVMAVYLVPAGFVDVVSDPAGSLSFLLEHQAVMGAWYFVLYLVGGAALVVVSLAVGDCLSASPRLARLSAAFGLIWSGLLMASGSIAVTGQQAAVALDSTDRDLAVNAWTSLSVVQGALGGYIEVAGAVWAAVVGVAVLRTRALSGALGVLALGLAAVGVATVVPSANEVATSAFGIGFIIWFTWFGTVISGRSTHMPHDVREA